MTQEERINFWSEEVGCPPKIPQENRCMYCTEFEDLLEHIINGTPVGKVFDTSIDKDENGWHICLPSSFDIGINFCPYCGRKLTEDTTTLLTHDANQWLFSDLDDTIDCF